VIAFVYSVSLMVEDPWFEGCGHPRRSTRRSAGARRDREGADLTPAFLINILPVSFLPSPASSRQRDEHDRWCNYSAHLGGRGPRWEADNQLPAPAAKLSIRAAMPAPQDLEWLYLSLPPMPSLSSRCSAYTADNEREADNKKREAEKAEADNKHARWEADNKQARCEMREQFKTIAELLSKISAAVSPEPKLPLPSLPSAELTPVPPAAATFSKPAAAQSMPAAKLPTPDHAAEVLPVLAPAALTSLTTLAEEQPSPMPVPETHVEHTHVEHTHVEQAQAAQQSTLSETAQLKPSPTLPCTADKDYGDLGEEQPTTSHPQDGRRGQDAAQLSEPAPLPETEQPSPSLPQDGGGGQDAATLAQTALISEMAGALSTFTPTPTHPSGAGDAELPRPALPTKHFARQVPEGEAHAAKGLLYCVEALAPRPPPIRDRATGG
jgi:hypothetical protein